MTRPNPILSAGGVAVLDTPTPSVIPVPPPAATPPAGRLKKLSFGGIPKKKEDAKTNYPVFPDPDRKAAELAVRIVERTEQFEALEGALKTDKEELRFMVAPHYFKVNQGRAEVPSSVAVRVASADGRTLLHEVLVTFQNRYPQLPDESGVAPILGEHVDQFFAQAFEIKIKGDKLPADHAQELINEIQTLFARFNCGDALELKEGVKPASDFHAKRHLLLTPEQNLALEEVCPIVAVIKTKGRK